jgi:hypothetical protein
MVLMLMGLASPGWADRGWRREESYREREREYARNPNWALDRRHSHNHYYPRRGFVIRELPRDYRIIRHRSDRYYFHDGIWYRSSPGGFVVISPPIGLVVPLLPPFYTTIWVGGNPYYYADGVYYRWLPTERAYVVSEPPPEQEVIEEETLPKDLFVYPKEGQSREQQDSDRYECHRWAVTQTGFDPTQPGGNVPEAQNTVKRGEYQRAMKACLEARGYSVQ